MTADDLQRRTAESRERLAAVRALREQQLRITEHSRRRLDASRRLLAEHRAAEAGGPRDRTDAADVTDAPGPQPAPASRG